MWKVEIVSLNQPVNQFNATQQVLLLGEIDVDDVMVQAQGLNNQHAEELAQLRKLCATIDERVEAVLTLIFNAGLEPIIIGGGHNNSFGILSALSKHSGIRYHWIRELIIAELIELKHVSSLNNESDLFTKPLGSTIHERLKTKVMNKKTDEDEPTKETSSNFSVNYEFTTSIDDELKSLIFTNGI